MACFAPSDAWMNICTSFSVDMTRSVREFTIVLKLFNIKLEPLHGELGANYFDEPGPETI